MDYLSLKDVGNLIKIPSKNKRDAAKRIRGFLSALQKQRKMQVIFKLPGRGNVYYTTLPILKKAMPEFFEEEIEKHAPVEEKEDNSEETLDLVKELVSSLKDQMKQLRASNKQLRDQYTSLSTKYLDLEDKYKGLVNRLPK